MHIRLSSCGRRDVSIITMWHDANDSDSDDEAHAAQQVLWWYMHALDVCTLHGRAWTPHTLAHRGLHYHIMYEVLYVYPCVSVVVDKRTAHVVCDADGP